MSIIQFRLAARTDAAGKYNPNAPLEGNEDNMFVESDLSGKNAVRYRNDMVMDLSDKGCLMVVADGMGGMNAGEVASAIAIKTVMDYFAPERLSEHIIKDSGSRMRYMESIVVAADAAIKNDSCSNPEHEGMGSTIIMAWLCGDEICLTWCGDSRAYLFRPGTGLKQVSKDHSYVQGLVDEGKITEEQAFDHPYGNVITRSLGDPEKKAEAESRNFKVYQGDVFMLCSDGLSGVLRDHKTYNASGERLDTENLEDIISEHRGSMVECRDCLFDAAQGNDWYDNVTAILCEIVKSDASVPVPNYSKDAPSAFDTKASSLKKKLFLFILIAVFAFGLGGFIAARLINNDSRGDGKEQPKNDMSQSVDTAKTTAINQDVTQTVLENEVGVSGGEGNPALKGGDDGSRLSDNNNKTINGTKDVKVDVSDKEKPKTDSDLKMNQKRESVSLSSIFGGGSKKETSEAAANDASSSAGSTSPKEESPAQTTTQTQTPNPKTPSVSTVQPKEEKTEKETDSKHEGDKAGNTGGLSKEEEDYQKCLKASQDEKRNLSINYLKNHEKGSHRKEVEEIFHSSYLPWIKTQIQNSGSKEVIDSILIEHRTLMNQIDITEGERSKLFNQIQTYQKSKEKELDNEKKKGSKHKSPMK